MTTGLVAQDQVSTFTTPVNGASPIDANQVKGNDNTIKSAYNTHDADGSIHLQSSLNAARPAAAAGNTGWKWLDNDTYRVYYSDGAAWHEIAYLTTVGAVPASIVTAGTFGAGDYVFPGKLNVVGDFSVNTNKFTVAAASGNAVVAGTLAVTGATTLTGGVTGALDVTGNFSVATNKFTVASASGNTVVAGTLGVTGATTINGGIIIATGGGAGTGSISKLAAHGLALFGITGSSNDFGIFTPSGSAILTVPTGTQGVTLASTLVASSTITGTRIIGGTDIASAIAPGTFSDGTAPANNAYSSANVFSLLVSKTVSATTGSVVTSEVYHKQTGANSAGSTIAFFSYIDSAHTSGTTLINIANNASVEATGNGGTTTTLGCYRTQALIGTGATVTALPLVDIRPPSNSGTITTLYGLRLGSMEVGGVNWAIYCGSSTTSGGVTFRDTALATNTTVGHFFIPSSAGPPTGAPANIPTGQVAFQYDTTNNKFWAYNGSWRSTVALT